MKPFGDLGDPGETGTSAGTSAGGSTEVMGDLSTDPTTAGPEALAGACKPVNGDACPGGYACCSDDPAVLGARVPNFFQDGLVDDKYGDPMFAGDNNGLSYSGQCVAVGGFASPFASGCPVPCNPRWSEARTAEICGVAAVCCSFTEVDPMKDCVIDPDTQLWRAVSGLDIPKLTNWGDVHATNQDPHGVSCTLIAGGPDDEDSSSNTDQEIFDDAIRQLTVADQRGFCYAASECPCREDLCAAKNPGYVNRCP